MTTMQKEIVLIFLYKFLKIPYLPHFWGFSNCKKRSASDAGGFMHDVLK